MHLDPSPIDIKSRDSEYFVREILTYGVSMAWRRGLKISWLQNNDSPIHLKNSVVLGNWEKNVHLIIFLCMCFHKEKGVGKISKFS
jgi:hypothetical protein